MRVTKVTRVSTLICTICTVRSIPLVIHYSLLLSANTCNNEIKELITFSSINKAYLCPTQYYTSHNTGVCSRAARTNQMKTKSENASKSTLPLQQKVNNLTVIEIQTRYSLRSRVLVDLQIYGRLHIHTNVHTCIFVYFKIAQFQTDYGPRTKIFRQFQADLITKIQ